MVKSTGVRGPTLARLAIVLVLLSIGNTPALRVMATSGEQSTGFPLAQLVEQERTPQQNSQKFVIFRNFRNFDQHSNF